MNNNNCRNTFLKRKVFQARTEKQERCRVGGPAEHHNCMLPLWRRPCTNERFHPGWCPSVYSVDQPHYTSSRVISMTSKLNSDTDKSKPQGNKKIPPARLSVRPLQCYYTIKHKDNFSESSVWSKSCSGSSSTCSLKTRRGRKMELLERCSVQSLTSCEMLRQQHNNHTKHNNHSYTNREKTGSISFPS